MSITASEADRVPARNLHVSRAEFCALWETAETRNREQSGDGLTDWYSAAVIVACRWLADAMINPSWGRPHPARSPATDRELRAYPESIEAEIVEAELLAQRRPQLAQQRPGWCEGIVTTLRWAWRAEGAPLFGDATAHRERRQS